ncbi:MAG: hypothetical protein V3T18_11820 [Pseudomonadales bacterium]
MNWDAIAAVGELIGAILVGATLIYLAFQLRQNTKALTSSTFQAVSSNMASNMEFFAGDPTISALLVTAQDGLGELTAEERARFGYVMVMAFRRIEMVFVQRSLGFIDARLTEGFERSAISTFASSGAREWWEASKRAFSDDFSSWIDQQLATNTIKPIHAGLGLKKESGEM